MYLNTTLPLQVSVAGVVVESTNTALTVRPQASRMSAGAPGFTAWAGHDTVSFTLAGGVNPPLSNTTVVLVQSAVVVKSQAV